MPDYLGANPDCAKAKPVSVGAAPAATDMIRPKWRRPRQPHPGTRIIHYRCFLPDLAGLRTIVAGGPTGPPWTLGFFREPCAPAEAVASFNNWRRGRDSNPRYGD